MKPFSDVGTGQDILLCYFTTLSVGPFGDSNPRSLQHILITWSAVFISRLSTEMRYDVAIIWPINLDDGRCYELCLPRGDMRFDKI